MRPRYFYAAIILVTIFGTVLVLGAAVYVPSGNSPQRNSTTDVRGAVGAGNPTQVDEAASVPTPTEPVPTQLTPVFDGFSLLETHCAQCHNAQKLAQLKKSRSEWEMILAQMESMGALLSDDERDLLLNYLVTTPEP